MKPLIRVVSLALLAAVAGACDAFSPGNCVAIPAFALNVLVRDSITRGPPPAGTRVIARDGSYADTARTGVTEPDGTLFALAEGRTGVYDVFVETPGYQPWSRTAVAVGRDISQCNSIHTVGIVAFVQP
jgi:hypothetical protein